jgi:hypothetical protein
MHSLNITSRGLKLPNRVSPAGEVFARVEFANKADADFFRARLGWSAFKVADGDMVPSAPADPVADAVPAPAASAVAPAADEAPTRPTASRGRGPR